MIDIKPIKATISNIEVNQLSEFNYDRLFNYDSICIDRENNIASVQAELKIDNKYYIARFPLGDIDRENPNGIVDDSIRLFENTECIDYGFVELEYLD